MSRVVRVLSVAEAADNFCDESSCDRDPTFAVALPTGERVVCEEHLDLALAAVPPGFVERRALEAERASCAEALGRAKREHDIRDYFEIEDALERVKQEILRRIRGAEPPDRRYDPIFDALLDLREGAAV